MPLSYSRSTASDRRPRPVMATATGRQEPQQAGMQQQKGHCRFWGSAKGCRAGDACPFLHDASRAPNTPSGGGGPRLQTRAQRGSPKPDFGGVGGEGEGDDSEARSRPGPLSGAPLVEGRQYTPPAVPSSRVVAKPTPTTQNPRIFQISQVKRRYNALETNASSGDATILSFSLQPSDPDFPFDLPKGLKCVLHVPSSYLQSDQGEGKESGVRPWLDVKNAEMGRGYQINIERGFGKLVERSPGLGLLGWMKELDKGLESMLAEEKADVVTFVPNQYKRPDLTKQEQQTVVDSKPVTALPASSQPIHTSAELREASTRRETETRQLEARIGRLPLFSKSSDGIAYTVPVTPRKPADLPVPLQGVKTVILYVPMLYPLQSCRIEVQGTSREAAKKTEVGFERRAKQEKTSNLMGHINWLAQNMHVIATASDPDPVIQAVEVQRMGNLSIQEPELAAPDRISNADGDDRTHIRYIARPPEWSTAPGGDESDDLDDSDDTSSEYAEDDDDDEVNGVTLPAMPETSSAPNPNPERGISLNLPGLELYGIELLELTSLSITIKCERCKDTVDISNLRSSLSPTNPAKARSESCKKCASPLSISYRHELMHANSFRAGYLDLEGCTVADMLPSTFIPTCAVCSTTLPPPGMVTVRGASTMAVCRECHRKLSFQIPEVKFLLISSAAGRSSALPLRRRPKENLGIVAGTELPRRGRCQHYNKSYRWFRFSCCSKVYPCDRCHDEAEAHPNDHANRMICGFCSREQNYRPDDCGVCRMSVVKKVGSGFWEGGKGTRDKVRMSRKDRRKFKRMPGGTVGHASKK